MAKFVHKFLLLYAWLVRTLLILFPDTPCIMRFRGKLYGVGMSVCGKNFQVSSTVIIRNLEKLHVAENVYLAPNVVVNAIDVVIMEDDVMVGFNSVLVSSNHSKLNGSYRFGCSVPSPILIQKGAWVGANCTVLAGAQIPQGAVLAANSCIGKKFTEGNVLGGVPAKVVR